MKKGLVIFVGAVLCVLALTGCSTMDGNKAFSSSSSGSAYSGSGWISGSAHGSGAASGGTAAKNKTIGIRGNGTTTKKITLLNLTGLGISSFIIKSSEEETFGENLLKDGDVFLLDEVRDVYYDLADSIEKSLTSTAENAGNFSELTYEIQVVLEDGRTYILHNFPFSDIEQGRILLQDEILFLEYVDPWTGEEVITRQDEIRLKKEAEEKAAEEKAAFEKAAAEQAAAEQAAAWQAQQQAAAEAAAWQQQQEAAAWQQQQQASAGGGDAGCIGNAGLVY